MAVLALLLVACAERGEEDTAAALRVARSEAHNRYMGCRIRAAESHDGELDIRGTRIKPGVWKENVAGDFDSVKKQYQFDLTECREIYTAELNLLRPR